MATVVLGGCAVQVVSGPPRVAPRPPDVEVSIFYERLRPYGTWVTVEEYGQVWVPGGMGPEWRPYVDGHWAYTEDGWLWVSDYEWGWAPFHYGRWARHPRYRWVWIPDTVWAPAWVTWRHGDDVVGWAPLGPRARWQEGVGLADDDERDVPPDAWCFVAEVELTRPVIREVARPVVQNVVIIKRTTNVTRYTIVNNRVVNGGVDVRHYEERTGRAVPRFRTADRDDAGPAVVQGGEIRVYRPERGRPAPVVVDERELKRRQDFERKKLESDQEVEHREEVAARQRAQADAEAARRKEQADAEAARRRAEADAAAAGRRGGTVNGGTVIGKAVPRDADAARREQDEARRRQEQEHKVQEDRHQEEKRGMTQRQAEERETARKNKEKEKEQEKEKAQEPGKARAR
jgi:hypothetical protein